MEVDPEGGGAVLLVDGQAPLAGPALTVDELGTVPDVVVFLDQFDMGAHCCVLPQIRDSVFRNVERCF